MQSNPVNLYILLPCVIYHFGGHTVTRSGRNSRQPSVRDIDHHSYVTVLAVKLGAGIPPLHV